MPHYNTGKNGMTKYGKKIRNSGPPVKGTGQNNKKKNHNSKSMGY